ncbi:TPA: hypothetical protein ACX6O7_003526 [Photobacterium damselae]
MINIIIVHFNGYFGQKLPTEKTIDMGLLKSELKKFGYNIDFKTYNEIANGELDDNAYYLIGSHQNKSVKKYIDDICNIKLRDKNVLPSVDMILAHENKGVQAMLNEKLDLGLLSQKYSIVSRDEYCVSNVVSKFTSGSGSSGVFIAKDNETYNKYVKKVFYRELNVQNVIDYIKYTILNFYYNRTKEHKDYFQNYFPITFQNQIKSKGYDYKCLVFFDKVYVLKRNVRPNDFRSSGSGNFEFVEVNDALLSYCIGVRSKLNVPYVSLDIMEKENGFECIEFQCVHFGPYTQMNAPFHYSYDGNWNIKHEKVELEVDLAYSIHKFLK